MYRKQQTINEKKNLQLPVVYIFECKSKLRSDGFL